MQQLGNIKKFNPRSAENSSHIVKYFSLRKNVNNIVSKYTHNSLGSLKPIETFEIVCILFIYVRSLCKVQRNLILLKNNRKITTSSPQSTPFETSYACQSLPLYFSKQSAKVRFKDRYQLPRRIFQGLSTPVLTLRKAISSGKPNLDFQWHRVG